MYFNSLQTIAMVRRFEIDDTITRRYIRFNAAFSAFITPSNDDRNPVRNFLASENDLFQPALKNDSASDMVGSTIQNREKQIYKPIGMSFRHKDQVFGDVIWSAFERVSQSNSSIDALYTFVVIVHSLRMFAVYGKRAIKTKARPLSIMAYLKASITEVKAENNCLAHAIVIVKVK